MNLSIPGPPERCAALIGYDAAAGYVVLFGGYNFFTGQLNDTWAFQEGSWTEVNSLPQPNATFEDVDSMIYDPELGCMLLVGLAAKVVNNVELSQSYPTWEFCNGQWSVAVSNGPVLLPCVGVGPTRGYDGTDGCAILLTLGPDGWGDGGTTNYTWEYCPGGNWSVVSATLPVDQWGGGLTWDPEFSGAVLFGGIGTAGATNGDLNETWLFSGGRWTQLAITGPPGRAGGILTFDTQANALVLTGGYAPNGEGCGGSCNDTWELVTPPEDVAVSIAVAPSEICALSEPDCSAFTTTARVSVQLTVGPANATNESGIAATGGRAVYGPYKWADAPNLTFVPYGSVQLASRPGVREQCVDVSTGSSICPTSPLIRLVGARPSLLWTWSPSATNDSLRIGDVWSVPFNVSASGPPFAQVPVDACVTVGCGHAGSAEWGGAFSAIQFVPAVNGSIVLDSWPVGTVQVLNTPPTYSSPSPVAAGPPPATGAPLPAPVGPAPVPVVVPIASAPAVAVSVAPSFTAAAAGILAGGGVRILLRPRSTGQALLARVSGKGTGKRVAPRIRGMD
ncbi:MAG: kelch motif-containing protein [Thermoplasmata archaeon]|nr:kelch motif-containing protein [Thermoplasmata archaeon]